MNAWFGQAIVGREMARWLEAPAAIRYGTAAAVMIVALVAKYALIAMGLDSFFLLLIPAVLIAALLGGVGPGILATCMGAAATYLTVDPVFGVGISDSETAGRLALFLVDGVLLSILAGTLREAMRQLRASRAVAELEHGRTALLQDLTARLASESDPAVIARAILERSSALVGCDGAWIAVDRDGTLEVLGTLEESGARASAGQDAAATTLARRVIASRDELWIDPETDEHAAVVGDEAPGFSAFASIAVVPLVRGDGRPFGALLFVWRNRHEFQAANRELKRAIARITAQALERADLYALQAARIEDLAEREVVREAFLAVLSHELRTPVTTIFGASALLARAADDETGLLGDIQDEAERLRRIVDDLLVLSRSERGAIEVAPEPTLLQRRVREIVEDIGRRYPLADLRIDAPNVLPAAQADPTALVQVVHNLVTNAIKYAGEDGPIEITIGEDDSMATVAVADHGPGLGDEPDAVFALFHRAAHTRKRASGTGIGLYVARELVRAMGGEITGTNRAEGGALFRFTLPLEEPAGLEDGVETASVATGHSS